MRPSLLGELVWCQLFSEPGAGSDLASLRTRAEQGRRRLEADGPEGLELGRRARRLGHLPGAHRPRRPKHKGITYFLVDMRNSAGIDVRPLREITGKALFNEVFLDDVFVPDDMVVGEVDDGWKLARTTLANERVAMATSRLSKSTERAIELAPAARSRPAGRGRALDRAGDRLRAARRARRRCARSPARGPGAESSVAKLLGVRNRQDGAELVVALHGDAVLLDASDDSPRRRLGDAQHPLPVDRGRHDADPAQRRRRADPRAAALEAARPTRQLT